MYQFASHFSSIEFECIWIKFKNLNAFQKLHAMSFNIFIWMELNFHNIYIVIVSYNE